MVSIAQLVRAPGCGPGGRGFESHYPPQKKALASASAFFNDVCLRQMMTASPNDVRFANDVCLTAHWGKHRIIAERSGVTSYLRSKCIISPQGTKDFVSKFEIALKEASETGYWLELLYRTSYIDEPTFKTLSSKRTSLRVI